LGDMVNSRRTAWAILMIGLLPLVAVAYVRMPNRRHVLRRFMLVMGVLACVYFPAYWNHEGTLAQPARAVRSVVAPDARDKESNEYRTVENDNLRINIQRGHSLGEGFGIKIDYVIPIVDLSSTNSGIDYITHNSVLWTW